MSTVSAPSSARLRDVAWWSATVGSPFHTTTPGTTTARTSTAANQRRSAADGVRRAKRTASTITNGHVTTAITRVWSSLTITGTRAATSSSVGTSRRPMSASVQMAAATRLVVLGGQHRPVLERIFTGSVVNRVAGHAPVAVAVVPDLWPSGPGSGRVVVAVKDRDDAAGLVARAMSQAADRGAELVVLHAWDMPTPYDGVALSRGELAEWDAWIRQDLEQTLDRARHHRAAPATLVIAMIGVTPMTIRTSLGSSPIPNQMMNSGMKASGGSGRRTSMTGSIRCRITREADMAEPRVTPATTPIAKPSRMRRRLVSASYQSGEPCDGYGRSR